MFQGVCSTDIGVDRRRPRCVVRGRRPEPDLELAKKDQRLRHVDAVAAGSDEAASLWSKAGDNDDV